MEHLAPLVISIFFFLTVGIVVGGYLFTRHRERMTIIDKGLSPEEIKSLYHRPAGPSSPYGSLKWGLLLLFVGLAAVLGVLMKDAHIVNENVIPGLVILGGGLGLVVYYFIARKKEE